MMTTNEGNNEYSMCRLCGDFEKDCSLIFADNDGTDDDRENDLASLINKYLPLKVIDDGKFPRTICPGCHIQLEATVQFIKLIIVGQKKIKDAFSQFVTVNIISSDTSINEDECVYPSDHNINLTMPDLNAPKKKRGRPKKKPILPPSTDNAIANVTESSDTVYGKRKRFLPSRFVEQIQGEELDRVFRSVDRIEDTNFEKPVKSNNSDKNYELGHMEYPDGGKEVVNLYKKRKAHSNSIYNCNICSSEFYSLKIFTAHVATHHIISQQTTMTPELEPREQIPEMPETPILESLNLGDTSIDINLDANVNNDTYYVNGSSMPDISADDISKSDSLNDKNDSLDTPNVLLTLTDPDENLYRDSNINDPVTELITSSIMPIATMPPCEMNKKKEDPEPEIVENRPDNQCPECNIIFCSKQSCAAHIRARHKGERPFKCAYCDLAFTCSASVNKHALVHLPKTNRNYACNICNKILGHPSSVLYHKETVHGGGSKFVCSLCNKSFKHRQLLIRHQTVHKEDRPFSCNMCNAAFKTKSNLMNHVKTHSSVKPFKCDKCDKSFPLRNSLIVHSRTHTGIKPHKCDQCGKSFIQINNLKEHQRTHTGEKPYGCEPCGKRFTSSSQYNLHKQMHQEDNELQCRECGQQFHSRDAIKNHYKRHSCEKPFKCDCGKSFVDRCSLRKHSRLHTGEKPYSCNICNKSFADNSNLMKHKKTHRIEEHDKTALDEPVYVVSYDNSDAMALHVVDETEFSISNIGLYDGNEILIDSSNITGNDTMSSIPEEQTVSNILDQFISEDANPNRFEEQMHGVTVPSSDSKYMELQNDGFHIHIL